MYTFHMNIKVVLEMINPVESYSGSRAWKKSSQVMRDKFFLLGKRNVKITLKTLKES